ncbi:uncharacterized protein LTR77_009763 [Saxophila tyrrhenica]|uniref:Uncharacterized protein n=1 Tax=Saxophila tyrrhenica TaxID=1690608 RepID=A0AAV9P0K4_9PEZI|nr:hypothetical protein LTR77_009763 [Saxophila tyrrhenica]
MAESKRKIVQMVYPHLTNDDHVSTYLVQQAEKWHEFDISSSLWGCFRMTVATYCRFWCSGSWGIVLGPCSWASKVNHLNCALSIPTDHPLGRTRGLTNAQILAFILVGYILGLAGAQCLFYALLRLKPRKVLGRYRIAQPLLATSFLVSEALVVAGLPVLLVRSSKTLKTMWFSLAQAYVFLQPAIAHSLPRDNFLGRAIAGDLSYGSRRNRRGFVMLWFAISIASVLLHFHAWFMAVGEIKAGTYRSLYQATAEWINVLTGRESWSNVAIETAGVIFTGLRFWNHWLRALGYDVVLSFGALTVWSAVNQTDAREMVKCSTNPWLEEAQAAVGQAASRIGDATEEMYDDIRASQPVARAGDAWGTVKEEARRRTASAMHTLTDAMDDDDDDEEEYTAPTRRSRRASVGRPRSRSRSLMSPVKRSASRRSSRVRQPSLSRRVSGIMSDGVQAMSSPTVGDVAGRAEAALLTYALGLFGGLGMASAAVFGAEE